MRILSLSFQIIVHGSHYAYALNIRCIGISVRNGELSLRSIPYLTQTAVRVFCKLLGCGTGILAIGAKKLGAGRVTGTDIDPQAVEAARDNAERNGCAADFHLPESMPEGEFSVVVANILANPLKLLAPALLGRVAPGGSLVLSGILARQADEVIAAYRAADPGLPLKLWREENGWVCLVGTRSAQAEA